MKMFKTIGSSVIKTCEVLRKTESCVWEIINGTERRKMISSSYECYFDDFESAKKYLINNAERKIIYAKSQLDYQKEQLKIVQSITYPE